MTAPAKKARRQVQSAAAGGMMAVRMPVMPAMRPWVAMSRTAARPMSMPPKSEGRGVKSVKM
jgi:hypothetical protein